MPSRLIDHSAAAKAAVEQLFTRRLAAACRIVANQARVNLSVPGTGYREPKTGRVMPKRGKQGRGKKTIYGAFPSKPGESPHKQTGRLRGSVATEVVGLVGRVGTNVPYGRRLEIGMDRPWLLKALKASMAKVKQVLASGGATGFRLK